MNENMNDITVEYLDHEGTVLARGFIASQVLTEGEHRQIQTFRSIAKVIRKGNIARFHFLECKTGQVALSPGGTKIEGEVKLKPNTNTFDYDAAPTDPEVVTPIFLDRLDVDPSLSIRGVFQTLTIKEVAAT
jgi:hypothetical protein